MNLNSDLGEGAGEEEEIVSHIDSANVACGVHAGSVSICIATTSRCLKLGVEVGAHPGFDDRASFGRVELPLPVEEIEALVAFQVAGLAAIARDSAAIGVLAAPALLIASAIPGTSKSITVAVACGVTSRGPRPVPPVVTTTSAPPATAATMASVIFF